MCTQYPALPASFPALPAPRTEDDRYWSGSADGMFPWVAAHPRATGDSPGTGGATTLDSPKMECAFSAYGPDPLQKLALARVPRAILRTFPQKPKSDILTPGAWGGLLILPLGKQHSLLPRMRPSISCFLVATLFFF